MFEDHALLIGKVEHRRVTPVAHRLAYRVFSVLVNLDDLDALHERSRLFSVNRKNLLTLHTSDLAGGKQKDLSEFARNLARSRFPETEVGEVWLQTYPRVLGYVFNPLSVYLCLDSNKKIVVAIYEASNTFGERTHYVQRVMENRVTRTRKRMLVSPFNDKSGEYGFSLLTNENDLTIGVSLRQNQKPILKTWFRAKQKTFGDIQILSLVATIPFMTLKVMAAIHYEAAKLWIKGLRPPTNKSANPDILQNSRLPKTGS